jgi:hypothetical protein
MCPGRVAVETLPVRIEVLREFPCSLQTKCEMVRRFRRYTPFQNLSTSIPRLHSLPELHVDSVATVPSRTSPRRFRLYPKFQNPCTSIPRLHSLPELHVDSVATVPSRTSPRRFRRYPKFQNLSTSIPSLP